MGDNNIHPTEWFWRLKKEPVLSAQCIQGAMHTPRKGSHPTGPCHHSRPLPSSPWLLCFHLSSFLGTRGPHQAPLQLCYLLRWKWATWYICKKAESKRNAELGSQHGKLFLSLIKEVPSLTVLGNSDSLCLCNHIECGLHPPGPLMAQASCWNSSHHLCVPELRKERGRREWGREGERKEGQREEKKGGRLSS